MTGSASDDHAPFLLPAHGLHGGIGHAVCRGAGGGAELNVVLPPQHGLSLCAGGGGLDMGLGLAEAGFATSCYVEWEEYPRDSLVAGQRAGYLHPAPIWDNVKTFDGRPWRGVVDTILAGYPCQPFSQAGQRKGVNDPRHLWPDVARIIREVEPEWVFLENVAGHITLGLEAVLRELWAMGWTPAVGAFSAAETGAPHERLRVFIVAHRASAGRAQRGSTGRAEATAQSGDGMVAEPQRCGGGSVANSNGRNPGAERQQRGGQQRLLTAGGGIGAGDVDDPACDCGGIHAGRRPEGRGTPDAGGAIDAVGNPAGIGCGEERAEPVIRGGRDTSASAGGTVDDSISHGQQPGRQAHGCNERDNIGAAGQHGLADACCAGPQGQQRSQRYPGEWQDAPGLAGPSGGTGLFPPGPGDSAAWADTLAIAPDLAPATGLADCIAWAGRLAAFVDRSEQAAAESAICRMADGLATRTRALRLLGNGVHPLAAAYAWRSLANALGLRPVDLEAADRDAAHDAGEFV